MKYVSTRGISKHVLFEESVIGGMADDGGLLLPESVPDIRNFLNKWKKLPYLELASEIISLFCDLPTETLRYLLKKSYRTFDSPEIVPIAQVGELFIAELFHGPTLAFKDLALQFLGNLFEYILEGKKSFINIIAATSGDTGSAAIYGVKGKKNIKIFVMYPSNKISRLQELQMITVCDSNVFNIAVEGTFDDCQSILKKIFSDTTFKYKYHLGAVNSINWCRILAQIVYYFYTTFRVMEKTKANKVQFSVPTGNFGDIFAGYFAYLMGLPISRIILATNENDILSKFFKTGIYEKGRVIQTLSPSMDIQVASNFERYLYYFFNADADKVRKLMQDFACTGRIVVDKGVIGRGSIDPVIFADSCNKMFTLRTINDFYAKYHYFLDPHTAVGVHVGKHLADSALPLICLATAHPAKFPDAIYEATGHRPRHPMLDALTDLPSRSVKVPPDVDAIKTLIQDNLSENCDED